MTTPPILSVNKLKKSFKENSKMIYAVNGLSFEIQQGEIFGLLGPNGAGKTTTINILTGITTLDEGKIYFSGKPYTIDCEIIRDKINVASGYTSLSGNLTIYQNLRVYSLIFNVPNMKKRILELLECFDLIKLKDRKVNTLSSGECVRVGLCKCFLNNPQLLFLDECTIGLDPVVALKTRKIIKELQERFNTSILFTSHNMIEVEQLCDRIGFMQAGKMLKVGTPLELKRIISKHIMHIYGSNLNKLDRALQSLPIIVNNKTTSKVSFEFAKEEQVNILKKVFLTDAIIDKFDIEEPSLEQVFIHLSNGDVYEST